MNNTQDHPLITPLTTPRVANDLAGWLDQIKDLRKQQAELEEQRMGLERALLSAELFARGALVAQGKDAESLDSRLGDNSTQVETKSKPSRIDRKDRLLSASSTREAIQQYMAYYPGRRFTVHDIRKYVMQNVVHGSYSENATRRTLSRLEEEGTVRRESPNGRAHHFYVP